ncbi:MAG TPA: hypothetical protein VKQ89_05355, partial [Candidatus Angelobacter sp.]|nr:hypothetical protein [Candidatus Angelobacter sp.]
MELAAERKLNSPQHYSPTSTPVLDVFRPLPAQSKDGLSAGEYFLVSSLVILTLIGLSTLRAIVAAVTANPSDAGRWAALLAPIVAALSAAAVHEFGHLITAYFSGFKITGIKLSPLDLGRHVRCGEPYCGDVLTVGLAALEPRLAGEGDSVLRRRLMWLVLAGPLGSLVFAGGLGLALTLAHPNFLISYALRIGAAFSIMLAVASLLPDVNRRGNFSDGARL